jgi:predicted nucleic acid-binding protein
MKLLETSYLVDYEQGHDAARQYYERHAHEPLTATTISMFELGFGVVRDAPSSLDELAASLAWVAFLPFTVEDALEAARINAELQAAGERVPVADTLIAGVARNRGADLVARDRHFDAIDGLSVEAYRS